MMNKTEDFVLIGFERLHSLGCFVFTIFFIIYVATLLGNFLIILLVLRSHELHTPMYYFLLHLSFCDIVFTTNIAPTMLYNILFDVEKNVLETLYSTVLCASWLSGFVVTLSTTIMLFNRDFCGPKVIDHFMCELTPLLKLSCSDTFSLEAVVFVLSIPII
ncbi:unnamed protein product, partial [Ranitomeya imitator]